MPVVQLIVCGMTGLILLVAAGFAFLWMTTMTRLRRARPTGPPAAQGDAPLWTPDPARVRRIQRELALRDEQTAREPRR